MTGIGDVTKRRPNGWLHDLSSRDFNGQRR